MDNNYEIYNRVWGKSKENEEGYINVSGGCRWLNARIGDVIKRNALQDKVKSIIDIGSGDGSRICHAMRYFREASLKGYDLVESAVASANKKYGSDRIQFYCQDVTQSSIGNRADMITAFGVLEHIEDWKSLVRMWGGYVAGVYTDLYEYRKNA